MRLTVSNSNGVLHAADSVSIDGFISLLIEVAGVVRTDALVASLRHVLREYFGSSDELSTALGLRSAANCSSLHSAVKLRDTEEHQLITELSRFPHPAFVALSMVIERSMQEARGFGRFCHDE